MENISTYHHSKYFITSRTDINGVITDVSEAFCNVSGYSKKELIGQTHSIVKHPETKKEVFKQMWEDIRGGKVWSGILKNKRKDGDYYIVDSVIEPIFDKNNNMVGYYSFRFDITSQYDLIESKKKIETTLKKFEKLFANVNSGIAIVDKTGHFLDVNPYLCNLLCYSKEEFLKMNCFETSNEHHKLDLKQLIDEIISGKIKEKVLQKECKRKDGTKIWLESTYAYFDDNSILVSINSIENLKKLENTTNFMILQSRDAAMGEMLSMIAHQWRQPLATLSTISSKMKIKYDLDMYSKDDFAKDMGKINTIVMHLSKTIEYFRNYFKPKSIVKENICEILENLVVIVEPLAIKENVELVFNCPISNHIQVDSRIDQVLLNFYKNAIEACAQNNRKGKIFTNIEDLGDVILIEIIDDAGGIPENIIDKIFEPYFSTKSKNGTGLGLFMSKNIIENNLGGKLSVMNISNGACFTIELKK